MSARRPIQVQEKDQLLSTQSVKVKELENQVVQCMSSTIFCVSQVRSDVTAGAPMELLGFFY
jgi:hypothetical protein